MPKSKDPSDGSKRSHPGSENLKPAKPGDVRNPWGRAGKNGMGGLSLKTNFRNWLNRIPEAQRQAIWDGLYRKACSGDAAAIKLMVSLNDECPDFQPDTTTDTSNQVTIVMPPKETVTIVKSKDV